MSSQKTDREEVYLEQTSHEEHRTQGAFNAIYNLVSKKYNDSTESALNTSKPLTTLFGNGGSQVNESGTILSNKSNLKSERECTQEQLKLQQNMHKSREIHRQLMNKKHRWKPSELELTVLKLHFEKNKYPTKEEKEMILKNLEEFNSNIDLSQLNRWFQHEREKNAKNGYTGMSKNTYKKFTQDDLEFLKEKFSQNTYPKTEEMMEMSKKLGVSLSKIENWYKHNRRSLAKKGFFTLKTKKYFKKDEVAYLLKMFELYPRPTKEQILEMGKHLNCNELQIKNWYSNKRKKQKLIAKRQGIESQETKLHQMEISSFPQLGSQVPDLATSFPNNTPIISFPQGNEQSAFMQSLVAARPLNGVQAPQIPTSYANSIYSSAPYMNGSYPPSSIVSSPYPQSNIPNGVVPVLLIPTTGVPPTALPLAQNNLANGHIKSQESEMHSFAQPQQIMFNPNDHRSQISTNPSGISLNNPLPQSVLGPIMNYAPFNLLKQNGMNQNGLNGLDMSRGPWTGQNQPVQQTTPIIIVKQPGVQGQPIQFGMQNQPNYVQANLNNGFVPNNFNQNYGNMPGYVSYEPPMQIQYLTSLYCPYSNNNIFSNYYPVMCQNGPNYVMSGSDKPTFGMEPGTATNIPFNLQVMNTSLLNNGIYKNNENTNEQQKLNFAKHERDNVQ